MRTLNSLFLFLSLSLLVFYSGCTFDNSSIDSNTSSDQPKDSEKISIIRSEGIHVNYRGLETLGLQNGDKASDFTLYTANGEDVNLFKELNKGRPILLIAGNYACRPAQKNLTKIEEIEEKYKESIDVYIIQVVEAHPYDSKSPYSETGEVWLKPGLEKHNIRSKQPKTYGERKSLAQSWKKECSIGTIMLMDSPDNDFWMNYGQAPNMAYLIHPNGKVYHKQVWFEKEEMDRKINELLDKISHLNTQFKQLSQDQNTTKT